MFASILFTFSLASLLELSPVVAVESVDFDVTQALIEQGFDVSAVPALTTLTGQSSVSGCGIACESLQYVYGNDAVDLNGDVEYSNFTGSYCGGHAAFAGSSNIEGGITVSLRNLNRIELSEDRKTAFIQPGNTWNRIYTELQQYDLATIGGRVAPIGIGGLTTGGGISFFSNIYGYACDNVASYEVVTATGEIVTADPSQNSDLYWALRGGGNNFGIVVDFELETIPLPGGEMWGGTKAYEEDQFPGVVDAFVDLVDESPSDPNAGTWVAWVLNSGVKIAGAELWYAKPGGQDAPIFRNFNDLTAVSDTTQNNTLANYTAEVAKSNPYGYRECFYVISVRASRTLAHTATEIFFEEAVSVQDVAGANPVMVWQAVTESVLNAMNKNGGNPLGLSAADGPCYIIQISSWWENEEDDARMYQMASTALERIKAAAVAEGVQNDWIYMNYASQFQDVISSYGAENKAALKKVASKYDPTEVFQKLQPGYFKLDRAPVPGTEYFSF